MGTLKDGQPDRDWFAKSVEQSRKVLELCRAETDRELQRILNGDV